jgi:putative ABC transport system permease protein
MRCLGAPNHLLMRVFMMRLVLFGLVASLVGCLLGWLGTARVDEPALGVVRDGSADALARARRRRRGDGLVALLGFALPPLFQLAQVSPLRALRRDLGAPRGSAVLTVVGAASAWPS